MVGTARTVRSRPSSLCQRLRHLLVEQTHNCNKLVTCPNGCLESSRIRQHHTNSKINNVGKNQGFLAPSGTSTLNRTQTGGKDVSRSIEWRRRNPGERAFVLFPTFARRFPFRAQLAQPASSTEQKLRKNGRCFMMPALRGLRPRHHSKKRSLNHKDTTAQRGIQRKN